jgi:hypothetical protein
MNKSMPSDWPYAVRVRTADIDQSTHKQLFPWCEEKFGPRWEAIHHHAGSWCCFWCGPRDYAHYKFHFRNSEDAMLFALRWA